MTVSAVKIFATLMALVFPWTNACKRKAPEKRADISHSEYTVGSDSEGQADDVENTETPDAEQGSGLGIKVKKLKSLISQAAAQPYLAGIYLRSMIRPSL